MPAVCARVLIFMNAINGTAVPKECLPWTPGKTVLPYAL
jgi:hypothetical protein